MKLPCIDLQKAKIKKIIGFVKAFNRSGRPYPAAYNLNGSHGTAA